jgi:hypothetical protein
VVMTMSWRGDPWTKPYLDSGIMMIANHNVLFCKSPPPLSSPLYRCFSSCHLFLHNKIVETNTYTHAHTPVIYISLLVMMATAPFGVFVALLGFIGIFSQSRKILSWYTVLLWPLFAMMTSIGYICFRRSHVSLYQKLKFSWINEYTRNDRLVIQNAVSSYLCFFPHALFSFKVEIVYVYIYICMCTCVCVRVCVGGGGGIDKRRRA